MKHIINESQFEKAKGKDLIEVKCITCQAIFERKKVDIKTSFRYGKKGTNCNKCQKLLKECKETRQCKQCGKEFIVQKWDKKRYCSQSCSATNNNVGRKTAKRIKCVVCNKECRERLSVEALYCSGKCKNKLLLEQKINNWLETGKHFHVQGVNRSVPGWIRKYLLKEADYKCEKCGWDKKNEFTNKVPLHIHHINHNPFDDKRDNLQVLCPCCHSLTKGYKGLNKGNGRTSKTILNNDLVEVFQRLKRK